MKVGDATMPGSSRRTSTTSTPTARRRTPATSPRRKAIKVALGDHAAKVAVSSTKSMIGHCLGGSGAIEAVVTVLTIVNGLVPPTINLTDPDPECDLDFVPLASRFMKVDVGRLELLRLRRSQRHARLQPVRRLTPCPPAPSMNVTVEIERGTPEPISPRGSARPARRRRPRRRAGNLSVCPHCGHHARISARERIGQLATRRSLQRALEPPCGRSTRSSSPT